MGARPSEEIFVSRIRGIATLALAGMLLVSCGGDSAEGGDNLPRAADGDSVKVHYTGRVEGGEVFDSSEGRDPLSFVVASGQVISGFDDAVRGLAVGETRTQRIEPKDGYGETNPDLVLELPVDQLPEGTMVGQTLTAGTGQRFTVVGIDEAAGTATVDANHFLAGKVLIFDVELVELIPAG